MVDVGGLEPGNYSVGIGDPSVIGNQAQSHQSPSSNFPAPANEGAPGAARPSAPAGSGALTPNSNGAPLESPGAVSPPQSNAVPATGEIPRSILAQVSSNPVSDAAGGTPPTGQVQPLTAPATGQVNPTNTLPTGRSNVAGSPAVPLQNELGTLTVDQSGTGRMQHVVEGVRVRNVVGQALIISTSSKSLSKTLPPNLDPTADPVPPSAQARTGATNAGAVAAPVSGSAPVVAGIIRLLSDRGAAPTSAAEGRNVGPATTTGQNGQATNPAQSTPSR